ncbi:uncharacterized protein BO87DRAFT_27508 [Aspergillus neoniger CBS 115656]|uniref:Uncharacterized protein n=1 Tax=Aspergillus neoniger (strain CBS 115656) TaxID=1448310 RepID=A0A318YMA6_ASPNB|nr:hypothetical protein BO87DRAFT_27508 [Aspergillus neoniger CBS 115656]PYH35354.1 hypothetical protein BO87DRAFT_27508 [Aspergillus neoniger CBS 115656]
MRRARFHRSHAGSRSFVFMSVVCDQCELQGLDKRSCCARVVSPPCIPNAECRSVVLSTTSQEMVREFRACTDRIGFLGGSYEPLSWVAIFVPFT